MQQTIKLPFLAKAYQAMTRLIRMGVWITVLGLHGALVYAMVQLPIFSWRNANQPSPPLHTAPLRIKIVAPSAITAQPLPQKQVHTLNAKPADLPLPATNRQPKAATRASITQSYSQATNQQATELPRHQQAPRPTKPDSPNKPPTKLAHTVTPKTMTTNNRQAPPIANGENNLRPQTRSQNESHPPNSAAPTLADHTRAVTTVSRSENAGTPTVDSDARHDPSPQPQRQPPAIVAPPATPEPRAVMQLNSEQANWRTKPNTVLPPALSRVVKFNPAMRLTVKLSVTATGDVQAVSVTQSSGNVAIDKFICERLKSAKLYPAMQEGEAVASTNQLTIHLK
ncbi:MAG: energy transducer TonB [Moraxella sp.]